MPMQAPELLKYHPNRYYQSRPFFRSLFHRYPEARSANGALSWEGMQELDKEFLVEHWNLELSRLPVELRPLDMGRATKEFSIFTQVANFSFTGRNIFHFAPALTDLLTITDVDDVLWEPIKLPYPCFYLWFGPRHHWPLLDPNYHVDGAYVSEALWPDLRMVQVFLTTHHGGIDYSKPPSFAVHEDVYYYFPFSVRNAETTVAGSFSETLNTHDSFNVNYQPPPIDPEIQEAARRMGKKIIQPSREESAQMKKVRQNLAGLPVFQDALKLVVNCLCYLSSPNRDVDARYPDTEATKRLGDAKKPSELKRIRKELAREGYTRVNFCGESLEREYENFQTGRELSAHWRRGHWRNQAAGPRHSEHKLIWIRPTLVRKDKSDEGIPGHVYSVDEPAS